MSARWDHSLRECALGTVLEALYAHEINAGLSSFWDGGWDVWLGDDMNGRRAEASFLPTDFSKIPEWLVVNAEVHWPGLLAA